MTEKSKDRQSGPATTSEETLGIDGTTGVAGTVVSSGSLNEFAVSALEPEVGLSEILPSTPYVRDIRDDGAKKISPHSVQWSRIASDGPKVENSQPLNSLHTNPLVLPISSTVGPEKVDDSKGKRIEVTSPEEPVHPINRSESKLRIVDCARNLETDYSNRLSCVSHPPSAPAIAAKANGYSIPQVDENLASQLQDQAEPISAPSELIYRPDPFGFRAVVPTIDLVRLAEHGRRVPCQQRIKEFLTSKAKIIENRAIRVLMTGARTKNDGKIDMTCLEEPGEPEEDMGTRKAKAVSRSWNRTDLVICHAFLILLTSYYSLGSVHSAQTIMEAVNDFTMRGEVRYYQFELALSMLGVSRILGIIIFVKLTNTYSRPLALFIATLVTIGGVAMAAFAVTWEIFGAGHALFHLGRSGALVVAQVIVSDTSDLGWRGLFCWGLEMGLVACIWTKPIIESLVTEKLGWHIQIWIFFSFAFPASIPPLIAAYVFHRRAKHCGFFPASQNVHRRSWWSLTGLWVRIQLFTCEFDSLGILLWTIGVGLLSTRLSVSGEMQAAFGTWMIGLLIGGVLCIMFLILWELWLNNDLKAPHKIWRQKTRQPITHCSGVSWGVSPSERIIIPGPAGYDSLPVEQVAAEVPARTAESQDAGKHKGWARHCGCLIGFLANFAMKIGLWSVWDYPEDLPIDYRQLVEFLQGQPALANIEFTSFTVGGLFVSFLIRVTKIFKALVIVGLCFLLCGPLILYYTDIYSVSGFQVILSQVTTGFGAGMIWISLLVGVQASCKKHTDVGMSIGLLTTSNALGEMTAKTTKRFMQSYLMNLMPPETSQKYFLRALNGHWSIMLLVAISATAFALVMAGVGLAGYNLDEVKQLVSGVVFGTDDSDRQIVYEEHPSWATPSPFIASPSEGNLPPRTPKSPPLGIDLEGTQAIAGTALVLPPDRSSRTNLTPVSRTGVQVQGFRTVTGNPTGARVSESTTEWETTPSESVISESRAASNSCTITSPIQVPSSYVDGMFTMDSDIGQTPRAVSPNAFESFGDLGGKYAPPQTDTVLHNGSSTTKQRTSRSRITKGSHITVKISTASGGQQFSFKKRQVGATEAAPGNYENSDAGGKSAWCDSTSDEECEKSGNISEFLTDTDGGPSKIDKPLDVPSFSVGREVDDQDIIDEQQDSKSQPHPLSDCIAIRPGDIDGGDSGSGQVPPDQAIFTVSSDGEEYLQRSLDSMADGRVSRFSYGTHPLPEESLPNIPNP